MKLRLFFTILLAAVLCFYGCTKTEIVEIIVPGNSTEETTTDETIDNPENNGSDEGFFSQLGDGTREDPYTVLQVIDIAKNSDLEDLFLFLSYVKGIVCLVENISEGRITYYISENGDYGDIESHLCIYEGYGLGGEKFATINDLQIGDNVIVDGGVLFEGSVGYGIKNSPLCQLNGMTSNVENGAGDEETDEDKDYELMGEGTAENPYTVADAVNIINNNDYTSDKVYVKGVISQIDEIDTQSYGTAIYHISEDGETEGQFEIYLGYSLDGNKFTSEDEIVVGDEVVVYGELTMHNSAPRMEEGSIIYSLDRKTEDDDQQGDDRENDEYYEEPGEGTMDDPFTVTQVADVVADGSYNTGKTYFVKGIVASISAWDGNNGWMSYYMSETGTSSETCLFVNEGYGLGGEKITTFNYMSECDKIIVYGRISVTDDGTPEMINGNLYYLNGEEAENVEIDDPDDPLGDDDDVDDVCKKMKDSSFIQYCLENFDTNSDGKLSMEEVAEVTKMNCSTATDFTGIEYFTNLQSFTSHSVKYIDLKYNTELTSVYMEGAPIEQLDLSQNTKITGITPSAFKDCCNLVQISLPKSVNSVSSGGFYGCVSLVSIDSPEGLQVIAKNAFRDCTNLTLIPSLENCTTIGEDAFANCSSLVSITSGNTVTSIGSGAFYGCTSLTSFVWSEKVETIELRTFYHCTNMTTITLPEGLKKIGKYAFEGCSNLTSVSLPESLTTIDEWAFFGCYNLSLTSDILPKNLTTIGRYAFNRCWYGLTSVILPESLTTIEEGVFYYCQALASVTLPENLTSIGDGAFSECAFASISLPETVTSLGSGVFEYCSKLTSITLPENVMTLGSSAFYHCENLSSVVFSGNKITSIGRYTFYWCTKLSSINLPENITSIGEYAFSVCNSLTSITLPEDVTSIDDRAFFQCSGLESISLPEGVTSVGEYCFGHCTSLNSVTSYAPTPPTVGVGGFFNIGTSTLYAPSESVDAYTNSDWTQWFSQILPIE